MRYQHLIRSAALLGAAMACAVGDAAPVSFGGQQTLSGSTTVGTTPMFAVSPSGAQALAWVSAPNGGSDGQLYVSIDGAPPTEIRDSLGPIEVHGESPPKLAYSPNGGLFAVYVVGKEVPGQRFPLSALRMVSSRDNGRTWSAPATVTDGEVFGSHSFHALHAASDGSIYVSWLGKPPSEGAEEASASASKEMAGMNHSGHSASTSWITRSVDGGATWSPRVRVDMGEACPCCRTALATSNDGTLYMAWRHVYPGSIRDVVVARSTDRGATWSEPVRVHADDWKFDACPHAGPAIAVAPDGGLHVTWWTGKEGTAGVYYARSTDGGKTFSDAVPLGVAQYSRPAHVQLSLASRNRVLVAWDDGTKQVPQVVVRVSNDGGRSFSPASVLSASGRAATFPVLAIVGDSLAVAWSEVSANAAQRAAEADSMAKAKDPKAAKGLESVGEAQVVIRRGALR